MLLTTCCTASTHVQGVPEDAAVDFEVELLSFDRAPNWHDAGPDEKIARAQALKEQGNAVFRQGPAQHSRARAKWMKALKMLDNAFDLDTEEQVRPEPFQELLNLRTLEAGKPPQSGF